MNFDYPRAFSWRGRSGSAPFDAGANCPRQNQPLVGTGKNRLVKAVNADISSRLDGIEAKLDGHITMDDRRTADSRRAQILHFNNELLRPINHTKEEFVEVLAKIDDYERYCEEHPEYPNNRAVLAIENIREVYKERLKKRDFLQESHAKDEEEGDVC